MTTIETLAPIFRDVFDDDTIVPSPAMTADETSRIGTAWRTSV